MKYFQNCTSIEEVKKTFRELAKTHHPDRGGCTETMQEINREFSFAIAKIAKGENLSQADYEKEIRLSEAYQEAINKIASLNGINIELVGAWIWVTGETYTNKTSLKEAGFLFAHKKVAWYFRTDEYKVHSRGKKLSLDQIRAKYGSHQIKMSENNRLTA